MTEAQMRRELVRRGIDEDAIDDVVSQWADERIAEHKEEQRLEDQHDRNVPAPHCPYCSRLSLLVGGEVLYPHRPDLFSKSFYRCADCDAYVGCHPGTKIPLGRLANAELRRAKQQAHFAFDALWKSGEMTRARAYRWLADALHVEPEQCHIGMFDVEQCVAVVAAVARRKGGGNG